MKTNMWEDYRDAVDRIAQRLCNWFNHTEYVYKNRLPMAISDMIVECVIHDVDRDDEDFKLLIEGEKRYRTEHAIPMRNPR